MGVKATFLLLILSIASFPRGASAVVTYIEDFESNSLGLFNAAGNVSLVVPPFSPSTELSGISAMLETSGFGGGAISVQDLEAFIGLTPVNGNLNDLGGAPPFVINGSVMKTTVEHLAGDQLSVDYNFLTQEGLNFAPNDFAFLFFDNTLFELINVSAATLSNSIGSSFQFESGIKTETFTFANSGTSTLAFGIVNVGGVGFQSALLLDNISITSTSVSAPPLGVLFVISALLVFKRRQYFRTRCTPDIQ